MQFHLNGFRPGDPQIALPSDRPDSDWGGVDVLIVGCGPAGLTLAAYLAQFPEISTKIIEAKPGPLQRGQADGVSCRSMEMFEAFGFAHRVKHEAYWVNEATFWKPALDDPQQIARSGRIQDVEDGLSEMPHVILNQARVHDMYLEAMRNAPTRLVPDYNRKLVGLQTGNLVTATVDGPDGPETISARYVVGCDGARSAVRKQIGLSLKGDSANHAWGVMDVLAVTDFPDIRYKCLIQSENDGSIIVIPREGGYLVRLYIEIDKLAADERVHDRDITLDQLIAAAQRILRPYRFEVKEVPWWSVYEIGQRLTDAFADSSGKIFIAGDACHTHSPKAGQGMNVSMGDGFNLGWKLAAVLRGQSGPALLETYSAERHAVAQDLINFDREWSKIIGARPKEGADTPEFQKYFIEHGRYTAGVAVRYARSALTGPTTWQHLAGGFEIGTRFHSAPVTRLADGKALQLGHVVQADGRWRLFAFAGEKGLDALCEFLADDPNAPMQLYANQGDIDGLFDLRGIYQENHHELPFETLPRMLRPHKGVHGLVDYEKAFCASQLGGQDIFDMRNIDRAHGALVIVRPDQYVGHVLALDDFETLVSYFGGIFSAPST